jgi:hypothetical protein
VTHIEVLCEIKEADVYLKQNAQNKTHIEKKNHEEIHVFNSTATLLQKQSWEQTANINIAERIDIIKLVTEITRLVRIKREVA